MNINDSYPTILLPADEVYPLAYGNEEETGLLDNHSGIMGEPDQLAGDLEHYLPDDLESFESKGPLFLQNGSKLYQGGSEDCDGPTNIERATPECVSPDQLALYLRASELLLVNTVKQYLAETSVDQPGVRVARIHRRVIDSYEHRKGCHDNFGISAHSPIAEFGKLPPAVLTHMASRSFISGAGLITEFGTNLAQKVGGLTEVEGYGYFGTVYRMTRTDGTPRVESRCNDINISEWAATVRVGSTAIALALNQTPLGSRLRGLTEDQTLSAIQFMNDIKIGADGLVRTSEHLQQAVDFQQAQADLALSRLYLHTEEMPPALEKVAREVYTFCDDFKKVLAREATIELLADRADWAAKFTHIIARMNRDVQAGMPRTLTDAVSRAGDLQYDYIRLSAEKGKALPDHLGRGYRLRNAGRFRHPGFRTEDITKAYYQPPAETRAAIRGRLIRQYFVADCDWNHVVLYDDFKKQYFLIEDVLQHELDDDDQERLRDIKQRRHR